ncbi:MAG TPA: ANTAR domain-containing protein [Longimicrobiaceae bacterium]|nr:ANTAR domain-containing protein [Longimicrobiaceae bacterium]
MDILLTGDGSPGSCALRSTIEALGHRVLGPASGPREAVALLRARDADLVVVALDDAPGAAEEISHARALPIVLVVARRDPSLVERAAHLPVFACLEGPVPAEELAPVIRLARARFEEWWALRVQVADLSRRMEGRRTVERAKGILMELRGISEGDAYRLLQRESQNRRQPIEEVAGTVVAMEGIFRARVREAEATVAPAEGSAR